MAEHEVRRVAEIAQQTLRFYRQSTLPGRANLVELIDSVLDLYRGRLGNLAISVERDFDPQLTVFCYSGEIRQVFANLVGNAIDAVPPGGRIHVRVRPSHDWRQPELKGVRFTVADTGSGMDPEVRERIFEAFFTTKDATGTGLGLWVSYEIIQKHRGTIRVRSRATGSSQPSGTVFQIFLPDDTLTAATAQPATLHAAKSDSVQQPLEPKQAGD
jgi:signal transduction histidine kinase